MAHLSSRADISAHTHLHFIVWAFSGYEPETGNCLDNVTLDLLASSVKEALQRAESIMPGRIYRMHSIIEHYDGSCG